LFYTSFIFAQIENERGEIILKNGDTLKCNISYFNNFPSDIITHDSNGVKNIISPIQVKEIKLNSGKKFIPRTYFNKNDSILLMFQVVIESSKISLYTRNENDILKYYVAKDSLLYRLDNNEIYVDKKEGTFKKYDYQFIGILKIFMSDRPDIMAKLDKIELSENDIIDVINTYNKGEISYFWKPNNKVTIESNWVFFGQFSNYQNVFYKETDGFSFGIIAGLQYYFSKNGRHSLRFTAEYSNYNFANYTEYFYYLYIINQKLYSIGCRYELDYVKTDNYNLYFLFHIADFSYVSETNNHIGTKDNFFTFIPRVSPGIGIEVKPFRRTAIYGEINHLFNTKGLPLNLSIGFKYDFGKNSF